jgi:hypothetical protein
MTDPLDEILRLVADGWLTAEEAAPVIDAIQDVDRRSDDPPPDAGQGSTPRALRIEVSEGGRKVVNLRVPLSLGRMAIDRVPGLSGDNIARIREAIAQGIAGPILVVDEADGGGGVRIVLE